MDEPAISSCISLETLINLWPIVICLSTYLSVNDLVSLARSSSGLRAALHGFGLPSSLTSDDGDQTVRQSIHVGLHATPYWQRLKDSAAKICASKTHKRGDKVHHCRLCDTLICEACIVRASFAARGREDTFRNRCRFFCQDCWNHDNTSKSWRYPLYPWLQKSSEVIEDGGSCTCTLKNDGWLCIECKDKQNYEAQSNDRLLCHGCGCSNFAGPDFESRRICTWCNKTLPRHVGSTSRAAWNQKMIEARTRNAQSRQADMAEYNRKRLQMMRMSRREMRGDEAVEGDPDADAQQFVRHLDSCCNYRNFMRESHAPDGNAIYASKKGYWRYSRGFLVEIGKRCTRSKQLKLTHTITSITSRGSSIFSRTNHQRRQEQEYCWNNQGAVVTYLRSEKFNPPVSKQRIAEWMALKTRILELAFVQLLPFRQLQITLQMDYGFDLSWMELRKMLNIWSLTPLWEGTQSYAQENFTDEDVVAWERRYIGLSARARRLQNKQETSFDNAAARIIEFLIRQGKVLPLRLDTPPHFLSDLPPPGAIPDQQHVDSTTDYGLLSTSSYSSRSSTPTPVEPDDFFTWLQSREAHRAATASLLDAHSENRRVDDLMSRPPLPPSPPPPMLLDDVALKHPESDWSMPIQHAQSAMNGSDDHRHDDDNHDGHDDNNHDNDDDGNGNDDDNADRASVMSLDSLDNSATPS